MMFCCNYKCTVCLVQLYQQGPMVVIDRCDIAFNACQYILGMKYVSVEDELHSEASRAQRK